VDQVDCETWLEANTIKCPLGRVSLKQCEALRRRPRYEPGGAGLYRPEACEGCTVWEDKMPEQLKRCSKCGEEKPVSEFYRDARARDGLKSRCKECYDAARRPDGQACLPARQACLPSAVRQAGRRNPPHGEETSPMRCSKCGRSLHWVNDDQSYVEGHYSTPDGVYCMACYDAQGGALWMRAFGFEK